MSAIVDAMHDAVEESRFHRLIGFNSSADKIAADVGRAADAINRASNAAQAGRVVRGAPRTWAVRWWRSFIDDDRGYGWSWAVDWRGQPCRVRGWSDEIVTPLPDLRPTWDGSLWIWSTAAHDPRGCGMPRAGEVRCG